MRSNVINFQCACFHVRPAPERSLHPDQGLTTAWKGSTVLHRNLEECITVQVYWTLQALIQAGGKPSSPGTTTVCTLFRSGVLQKHFPTRSIKMFDGFRKLNILLSKEKWTDKLNNFIINCRFCDQGFHSRRESTDVCVTAKLSDFFLCS